MQKNHWLILLIMVLLTGCIEEGQRDNGERETKENDFQENAENLMQKNFLFEAGTDSLSLTVSLDTMLREKYRQAPHTYTYQGNKLPAGWREEYYQMFIQHPEDKRVIANLLAGLKQMRPGGTPDELAELAVSFVQGSITYDWHTYHNIDQSQIRYPYETLIDGTGVCADKTILLARILDELGYGLAIFTFERANHMALGLQVPSGYDNYRSGFAFVESTNYAPIGRIPDNYVGGLKLDARPSVIRVNSGGKSFDKIVANRAEEKELEKKYGKEYFFLTAEQRELKVEMYQLEQELDSLKKELKGCRGTLPQDKFERCNKLQEEHNSRVEKYNGLVARFNSLNERNLPPA